MSTRRASTQRRLDKGDVEGLPTRSPVPVPAAESRRARQAHRRRGEGGRQVTARPMGFTSRYATLTTPPAQRLKAQLKAGSPQSTKRVSKPPTPLYIPPGTPGQQTPTPGKRKRVDPKPTTKTPTSSKKTAKVTRPTRSTPAEKRAKKSAETSAPPRKKTPSKPAPAPRKATRTGRLSVGRSARPKSSSKGNQHTEVDAIANTLNLCATEFRAGLPTRDIVPELEEFLSYVHLELDALNDSILEHNVVKAGAARVAKRRKQLRDELLTVNKQEHQVLQALERNKADFEKEEAERKQRQSLHSFLNAIEVLRHSRPGPTLGGDRLNAPINLPGLLSFAGQHSTALDRVRGLNDWLVDVRDELQGHSKR